MTIQVREQVTQPKGSNGKLHGAVAGEALWRLPPTGQQGLASPEHAAFVDRLKK